MASRPTRSAWATRVELRIYDYLQRDRDERPSERRRRHHPQQGQQLARGRRPRRRVARGRRHERDHPQQGRHRGFRSGSGDRLDGNVISDNTDIGIDLGGDGPTANDAGDGDPGPNDLTNSPIVIRAEGGPGGGLGGSLNSTAGGAQDVTFYHVTACDDGSAPQGGQLIGTAPVTTDINGNATFALNIAGLPTTGFVTAVATNAGHSTSEFSPARRLARGTTPGRTRCRSAPGRPAASITPARPAGTRSRSCQARR